MSTIWDYAVRAIQAAHPDLDTDGGPLTYYCGGPQPMCQHHACRTVSALAEEDLLNWSTAEAAAMGPLTDTAVEIATDVIGRHQYSNSTRSCGCGWTGSHTIDHPRHVADRLNTVGVLRAGGQT